MAKGLTDKQRAALDAVTAARVAGMGITAYANAHGLSARQLHDSIVALRRRGVLPPTDRPRGRTAAFMAVRVVDAPRAPVATGAPRAGIVCRLIHASGLVIECGEWPPAALLMSLTSGQRDAAS
jgi:hypothetical protein